MNIEADTVSNEFKSKSTFIELDRLQKFIQMTSFIFLGKCSPKNNLYYPM